MARIPPVPQLSIPSCFCCGCLPPCCVKATTELCSCSSVVEVDAHEVDQWMPKLYPEQKGQIPDELLGIFWMDGNPAPENLFCLNSGKWNAQTRTLQAAPFSTSAWTYDPPPPNNKQHVKWLGLGEMLWNSCFRPGLLLRFSEDELEDAAVGITINPVCCPGWFCCVCCHSDYCMEMPYCCNPMRMKKLDEEGHAWSRYSKIGSHTKHSYTLRKIWQQGQRLPAYQDMQERVDKKNYTFQPWSGFCCFSTEETKLDTSI